MTKAERFQRHVAQIENASQRMEEHVLFQKVTGTYREAWRAATGEEPLSGRPVNPTERKQALKRAAIGIPLDLVAGRVHPVMGVLVNFIPWRI